MDDSLYRSIDVLISKLLFRPRKYSWGGTEEISFVIHKVFRIELAVLEIILNFCVFEYGTEC